MWTARVTPLPGRGGFHHQFDHLGRPAAVAEVVDAWRSDASFRIWFNDQLAAAPFAAFRWEVPMVTAATVDRPFECVLLDAPGLDRRPEPDTFADHFARHPDAGAVAFTNLGGDSILIAPAPLGRDRAYVHLGAFVRSAPEVRRDAFWQTVGAAAAGRIGDRPVWLSTAGAGGAWLHARLDDRPKYYGYEPYRTPSIS